MRSPLLARTALIVFLALPVAAVAADSSDQQSLSSKHGAFSDSTHASDIIGKTAYGSGGESIGSVNDLLINSHGQVQAAVVDVGGFLGMGQHTVALDWNQLKVNPSNNRVTINMTKDQLKSAPEYNKTAQTTTPSNQQSSQAPGSSSSTAPH